MSSSLFHHSVKKSAPNKLSDSELFCFPSAVPAPVALAQWPRAGQGTSAELRPGLGPAPVTPHGTKRPSRDAGPAPRPGPGPDSRDWRGTAASLAVAVGGSGQAAPAVSALLGCESESQACTRTQSPEPARTGTVTRQSEAPMRLRPGRLGGRAPIIMP